MNIAGSGNILERWVSLMEKSPVNSASKMMKALYILLECPALGRRRIPLSRALDNKEVDVNIGLKVLDLVRGTEIERHC